ncbi:MAG: tRNA uridine(34) 5-carboxymethylaminomethyl modification radical SAM/GNAT enzyme Elp3 [Anaerolineae bacterium]|nr:tRNA uridine(34) 5-carboxymethylaminomethyl modification radical SAM/GNAT enzyme Elp3 [Anaerolineae bacterium]
MVKGGVPQTIDITQPEERALLVQVLRAIQETETGATFTSRDLTMILRQHPRLNGDFYAKSQLLGAYRDLVQAGIMAKDVQLEQRLRGRPVRTISGVAPVAILTEPYPCPGTCIFCPEQSEAPKSYLDGEPGVLRAIQNKYDPYAQTYARMTALEDIGHPVDKVELLILGGTWSFYPEDYRTWFLRRAFDAMNEAESATLADALHRNETAPHRNVGLVVETRPDWITAQEISALRQQGVTKVQIGAQSFDNAILSLNRRGHTLDDIRRAMRLLRLGGFKIVVHWMPNLYGATPESDLADFRRLWDDPALQPDEMKIYPTALLEGTDLYALWKQEKYVPYGEEMLINLLVQCKSLIPPYCRVNRLMRDIPAHYIVAGTTKSNLRQIVQQRMEKQGIVCQCIRCREVRGKVTPDFDHLYLDVISYTTDATREHFLQMLAPTGHLAGFLRLSLPAAPRDEIPIPEIHEAAMIRELHIYGPAQALGKRSGGLQHQGLGTELLEVAANMARAAGYPSLAVIAAAGTRHYYRERGFTEGELYPQRIL